MASSEPPLGLLYLATHLAHHGIPVSIIDGERLGIRATMARLRSSSPDIIGITSTTFSFETAANWAARLRALFPNTILLLGGPHASALPYDALRCSVDLDGCVVGEGEDTLLEFAQGRPATDIAGLVWRNDSTNIQSRGLRAPAPNLDRFGLDWDLLEKFPNCYSPGWQDRDGRAAASLVAGRGCAYGCTFCAGAATHGTVRRTHSPAYIVEMIRRLNKCHGVQNIYFHDDNFTQDRRWLYEFCGLMSNLSARVRWSCATRTETVNDATLAMMREAGCFQVGIGVESASQPVLDSMRKGVTVEALNEALAQVQRAGIRVKAYLIIGTAQETWDDLLATWRFIRHHRLEHVQISYFTALPGSAAFRQGKNSPADWRRMNLLYADREARLPRSLLRAVEFCFYGSCYLRRPGVNALPVTSKLVAEATRDG